MRRLALAFLCLLAGILPARAQIWNLAQYAAPSLSAHEAVFDNSGSPWPSFNQISAVNYDLGGLGIGYSATQSTNPDCIASGAATYRTAGGGAGDWVNFKVSADSGTSYLLGCTAVGQFFRYTTAFSQGGPYVISMRLANGSGTAGTWTIALDGATIATVDATPTGSYSTFSTQTSGQFNATFPANHILTATCTVGNGDGGCGDFNWLSVAAAGSIPVPLLAQQAGFTTLALNADFSQPQYAVVGNWVNCGSTAHTGFTWQQWDQAFGDGLLACNYPQVNDGGNTAIRITYPAGTTAPHSNILATRGTSDATTGAITYPFGYYEVEMRMGSNVPHGYGAYWTTAFGQNPPGCPQSCDIEYDHVELSYVSFQFGDSVVHNWGNGGGGCGNNDCVTLWSNNTPVDQTQYHKYAGILTSDGSSAIWYCALIDNNIVVNGSGSNCTQVPSLSFSTGPGKGFNQRNFLLMQAASNDGSALGAAQDVYIKTARVWTCPNWQTTQCFGPLVHN